MNATAQIRIQRGDGEILVDLQANIYAGPAHEGPCIEDLKATNAETGKEVELDANEQEQAEEAIQEAA